MNCVFIVLEVFGRRSIDLERIRYGPKQKFEKKLMNIQILLLEKNSAPLLYYLSNTGLTNFIDNFLQILNVFASWKGHP